jgi:membrane-bound ClpP family serine protease
MKKKKIEEKKSDQDQSISSKGKKVILIGIIILILGFFILTKTDPEGQNWASILSPFLIVGGYITIAIGIILPDKQK